MLGPVRRHESGDGGESIQGLTRGGSGVGVGAI
uniref:Uncharacterized protein n=1 Tax=Arundo donax TaxID=35708 RepID=A0A0A9FTW9_ARUDO